MPVIRRRPSSARIPAVLAAVALAACSSARARTAWGFAGTGATFDCQIGNGARWRFEVRGRDLLLAYDGGSLTLLEALPAGGVRYAIDDLAGPSIVFVLRDGSSACWHGREIEVHGATRHIEGQTELRLADSARAR